MNNFRQMGLAAVNHESARGSYPPGRLEPDWIKDIASNNPESSYTNYNSVEQTRIAKTGFYSVHTWILPYMEANTVYDMIDFDTAQVLRMTTGGGTTPFSVNYLAYATANTLFLCPSDFAIGRISENSYRVNFGGSTPADGARSTSQQTVFKPRSTDPYDPRGNGAFTIGDEGLGTKDFKDGLSKTAFFSERIRGSGLEPETSLPTEADIVSMPGRRSGLVPTDEIFSACLNYTPQADGFNFTSAGRWLDGSDYSNGWPFAGYSNTQYNHVASPNWGGQDCGSFSSIPDTPGEHAIVSARSYHPGTVVVVFGDGHTQVVSDGVDLLVWRTAGSRNGGEPIGIDP